MDDDLIQRLLLAENDLLVASRNGPQMLGSYRQMLSALPGFLSTATAKGNLGAETLLLANSVASRISQIASCFLDVKREENISTAQLHSDCDAMFQSMTNLSLNSDDASGIPSPSAHPAGPTSNVEISPPPAYQWLMKNLHNPYPSAEAKTRLATASSCPVASINSWFANARRRIGWTVLCREHFSSCRADMLDAAYRALVEEDPRHVLSPDIRHSFVAMKVAAEGLYSPTSTRSAFVEDMYTAEEDTTDKHGSVEVGKCGPLELASPEKTAEYSYPSPAQSIAESLVPVLDVSLVDESEGEEVVAPPILAGSKRRRSCTEPENLLPAPSGRPTKRLRASVISQIHLPSPPSSTDGTELLSGTGSPRLSSGHLTRSEIDKGLPPRVPDAEDSLVPKRVGGFTAGPRPHTVPDPLHRPNIGSGSIDDWFNINFDSLFVMPPPADTTEPDFSTSWDVELFKDYFVPKNSEYGPTWPSPAVVDTDLSAVAHLSGFDNLLQPIANDAYVAPLGAMFPSTISGAPYTGFLDSSIPDISQIDWTSLLSGSDTYQSAVDPTFSQYPVVSQPLPDIGLSILQLPHMPTTQPHDVIRSKRAKLGQLHAMQEAVRRMEQELQSEGVIL